eukprot:TRINITY_DN16249_c0_g1_i1.p1 TRINITY_DN16249_c0_g1~~TRINITY_DN16249_c0_g1_i1.p1  ORF type:complete len:201 (+),score=17.77 TRINITY_DN16249_c0_g1_i1:48-650(+)
MSCRQITIVAAVAKNGVIGNGRDLVWNLPTDMSHFMATTKGSLCVMGRGNWESIPDKWRPLRNRTNIVMTTQRGYPSPGGVTVHSINDVLSYWKTNAPSDQELFIIGGSHIYSLFLPLCNKMILTHIDDCYDGNVVFPTIDYSQWSECSRVRHPKDSINESGFDIVTYVRKNKIDLSSLPDHMQAFLGSCPEARTSVCGA